ncbi:RHS repeat-associated core domain-containing protein [Stenotrophomonas sp. S48]|uniref:RHS repeat-associated core domain-containing protein n=1 Tax=unclassified Stenotrophomonas TaxID=196198 RepID=UPI0019003EF0|nr:MULTISPECIES: RHS repeat-associated core domain-containing protein [unclassified Stenotrophomonas]MBK0026740.1 RHS repeat-associated core domain-containing protein [Stenotrophomonas sp. S48]MBK0047962.1 RHS repeat-associated core domain-containing protein [Stenotrophomonas sp. S49]
MFKRIKAEWLLALSLALPGLAVGASAYAQEVGKEWTAFPYLPGQKFLFESAARQSIETMFAGDQVDVPFQWYVHSQAVSPRETTTDYRFQPLALIKADWTYTYASQPYASDELFMQAIRTQNASDPQCPALQLDPIQWVEGSDKGPDGSSRRDTATLSGTRYLDFGGGSCLGAFVRGVLERKRRVDCPNKSSTQWNAASGMCEMRTAGMMTYKGPPQPKQCPMLANPCNPATGDKSQPEPDFDLGWVSFQRHYHSLTSTAGESLGIGWTHSHNIRLATGNDPTVFPPALSVGLIDPDGNQIAFVKVGTQYEANDGSGDRAVQQTSGWQVSRATERLYFNNEGRMQHRDFEDGTWLAYAYDARGRLLSVTHSSGRQLTLHYAVPGNALRISSISLAGQALVSYAYSSSENLLSATYADGSVRSYHYEDARYPNYLTGVTAEDNRRFSWFGYDEKGRVIYSRHSPDPGTAGAGIDGIDLAYLPAGDTVVTDALGKTSTYQLTAGGPGTLPRMVTGSTDAAGTTATVLLPESTDFRRRVASSTDRRGTVTQYAYAEGTDPLAGAVRVTTTTEAAGTPQERVTETRVAIDSNRVVLQTVGTQEIRIARNARLQPTVITVRDTATDQTRVTTLTYCEAEGPDCAQVGALRSTDGPRTDVSDVTTRAWYTADDAGCASGGTCSFRKGDLRSISNALGHTTETLSYDTFGRPLSVRDGNGVVTDYSYHPRGWPTSITVRGATTADDRSTQISYWPTGQVQQVTEPDGSSVTYVYDAAQRLTDIADSAGNTIHYTLDDAGNRLNEDTVDAGGTLRRTLARTYNTLGQLTALKDAGNHATGFTYDANGNPQTVTDALQRVTSQQHDPLNRLAQTLQDVGGVAAEISSQYNALDQVTQVTDPKGLHTTYAYNGFGDLTGQVSPDSGTSSFTVDAAGNRKTRTDARGVTATYSYDALNRLIGVAYPDPNLDIGYSYDVAPAACAADERFAKGRLGQVLHANGSTQYCHDRFGQITRKVQTINGVASTLRYAYSKAGRLTALTYPDGSVADYVRDPLGRISQVGLTRPGQSRQVVVDNVTYAAFGPATGWSYGNGRQLQRPLDLDYRPQAVHDPAAGGLSLSYGYDPVGSITELKNGAGSTVLATYAYDTLGRLTQTQDGTTGTPIETYAYDATGNRTALTTAAGVAGYTYPASSHRLTAVDGEARGHDAAGNTTSIGSKAFTYNDANRMNAVKQGSAVLESYAYNHRGERVLRTPTGGTAQITLYDEAGQWLGNYSASGEAQQQAIWLDNYPVALINVPAAGVPELAYVQPDHLGTPRVVIDPVRDVAIWEWSNKSEVFGNQIPSADPDSDGVAFELALRFPGQQATDASGMFYNYQREYDPAVGRYSQSDPIGLAGGISTFVYATGNSIGFTDPLGLNNQFGAGASASGAGPGVAVNFSGTFGISVPKDRKSIACYQIYGSLQMGAMLGGGAYLGAGASVSASESSGPLPPKSWGVYRYSELAGGWGPSIGGSVQGTDNLLKGNKDGDNWAWLRRLFSLEDMGRDKIGGGSASFPPLPGVGFGFLSGSGYTISGQLATPTGEGCGCP